MRIGNKKIFHLEAWVVKVMSLYKVCPTSHATRRAFVTDAARDSISSTTSTWTASTSEHYGSLHSWARGCRLPLPYAHIAATEAWLGDLYLYSYTRVYAVL